MTHATEQLQGMTDAEINMALADLLKVKWQISAIDDECLMVGSEVLDYCNAPNDIMPLAFERKIRLEYSHLVECWSASAWKKTGAREQTMIASFGDENNPLRAIACLLLLIGGGK